MKDRFNLYRFASPATFYPLAGALIPYFVAVSIVFGLAGLWLGMLVAPTDFQQGEGYRIIFIHVPASWMSMFIYLVMAFWAAIGLAFNTRLSGMMAQALAPTGALMAFLSLWTGALWGKPMWGAWWVWDARLTSELILLFLYIGYMALTAAIDDARRADKAGGLLLLVGVVNVRGLVLPVVDLRARFSLPRVPRDDRQRIILFAPAGGGAPRLDASGWHTRELRGPRSQHRASALLRPAARRGRP